MRGRITAAIAIVATVAVLAACSRRDETADLENLPPDRIFARAEARLAADRPKEAARLFEEVERIHPYSEWAKRALVMAAWAHHQAKEYEEARAAAQRYLDFYPAGEDAAWAQYILALTYYDQIDEVGRDQGITYQALQALRTVIERYPDSDYARSALLKFDLAFDQLAAKEMEVGRYYLKRGHHGAAINRFRVVVEDFPTSTQTPEALYRLVEAYLALGLDREAQTAAVLLAHNFRATEWYALAYDLLKGKGLRPEARSTGWLRAIWRQSVKGEWL